MSKYKLVIFDLDGTILNTIGDIHNALNYALRKNELQLIELEDAIRFIGNGMKVLVARTLDYVGININENKELYQKVIDDYSMMYSKASNIRTAPYEGVDKLLTFLKRENIRLSVLTNKPHNDAVRIVDEYFPGIFDYVLGAQPDSKIKPDPEGALKIIEYFGFDKSEVLFVGDSGVDLQTAKNCGVDFIGCEYGYGGKKDLHKAGSSYIISKPLSLLRFFRKDISGILLIDKPVGISSQDALTKIKRTLNITKIGHAGTLDPLASGLLVGLLGDATKLSEYLLEEQKEYVCEITIGKETTTLDSEGSIIDYRPVEEEINPDEVLEGLVGEISMVPPMYSAIKINGVKMYELAREGKTAELKERKSTIYNLERTSDIEYDEDIAIFEFWCRVSKGTYIRSLCKEIGNRMGYPAYMSELRRIKSGGYSITEAYTLEDIEEGYYNILPMIDGLKNRTIIKISSKRFQKVKDGCPIYIQNCNEEFVFLKYNDRIIAIYQLADPETYLYKAKRVWK